jgi:hypothetical protein
MLDQGLRHAGTDERGIVWRYDITAIRSPFLEPVNDDIYRTARAAANEQLYVAAMLADRYPDHVFALIGLPAPADGLGPIELRAAGGHITLSLIVRVMQAYCRSSSVFGEVVWIKGKGQQARGENRIRNAPFDRNRRDLKDTRAALTGVEMLLDMTKRRGPKEGTVDAAIYTSVEEWHAALRTLALAKPIESQIPNQIIETVANRLSISGTTISPTTVRRYMAREGWGPKTPEELRNGKWDCGCHSCVG